MSSNFKGVDFEVEKHYSALSGGAMHKPAIPVGAPAISQHIAFRIPTHLLNEPDKQLQVITEFLQALQRRIYPARSEQAESIPKPISGREARLKTYRYAFGWQGMPVRINFEMFPEYFALSTIIDLSGLKGASMHAQGAAPPGERRFKAEGPMAVALEAAMHTLDAVLHARHQKVGGASERPLRVPRRDDTATLKQPHSVLYFQTWHAFFNEFYAGPKDAVGEARLGKVFTDMRGVLLARASGDARNNHFMVLPNQAKATSLSKEPFARPDDVACIETLLPLLAAGEEGPGELVEYAFSRLLEGRCLHASAMGTQYAETSDENARPLVALLLANYNDKWQMGRLIERGHVLSTLRHAMLFDFKEVLDQETRLRKALADLADLDTHLDKQDDDHAKKKRLKDASCRAIEISKDLGLIESAIQPGGLARRINRSDYYWNVFTSFLDPLRVQRIEGSQTYNEFVRRRLGGIQAAISQVGKLNEQAHKELDAVNRRLQLQQNVRQTGAIEKIQEYGDLFLCLILLPYYGTGIVKYALNPGKEAVSNWSLGLLAVGIAAVVYNRRQAVRHWATTLQKRLKEVVDRLWTTLKRRGEAGRAWIAARRIQIRNAWRRSIRRARLQIVAAARRSKRRVKSYLAR